METLLKKIKQIKSQKSQEVCWLQVKNEQK